MKEEQDGKIPCTVIISKTIQEKQYEPFVVELQETRWVNESDYDLTHEKIYDRLNKRLNSIMADTFGKDWATP